MVLATSSALAAHVHVAVHDAVALDLDDVPATHDDVVVDFAGDRLAGLFDVPLDEKVFLD